MLKPGDVVTARFRGAIATKYRPTVVVSTDLYQATRPDVVVAELTTNIVDATGPTDYVLHDWATAGLHRQSAFGAYFGMHLPSELRWIGHVSDRDWQEIQARLRLALAVT